MTLTRREDDPSPDVTPEAADELFASLPQVLHELKEGRRQNRRVAKQGRAIALFVLGVGLVFGLVLQDAQKDDRREAFKQCQLVNDNAVALNGLIDTVITRIRQADMPADEKARAVALYNASRQSLPVCRK